MRSDSILEELRRHREALLEEHGNDPEALEDFKDRAPKIVLFCA